MTFPIKKRINTELSIDKTTACYVGDDRIKDGTNWPVVQVDWGSCIPRTEALVLISKGVEMRDQVQACLEMNFTGMGKKLYIFIKIV